MQKVVKLSGNKIEAISNILGITKDKKLPMNISMWIIRNVKYMEKEVTPIVELSKVINEHEYKKEFDKKRTEVIEKFSEKDENGNPIKTDEIGSNGEVVGYKYSLLQDDISKESLKKALQQINVDLLDLQNEYLEKTKELNLILNEEVEVNVYTISADLLVDQSGQSLFTVEELYTIEPLIEY